MTTTNAQGAESMSGMTDSKAISDLRNVQDLHGIDLSATIEYITARLRGEAARERCVECGEDEPRTGACGSTSPRALCNRAEAAPEGQAVLEKIALLFTRSGEYFVSTEEHEKLIGKAREVVRILSAAPAAPAPVAGDVPRSLVEQAREQLIRMGWSVDVGADAEAVFRRLLVAIRKALAQDRASQAGAADDMEAKAEEYRRIHADGEAHGRNMAALEATQPPAVGVDVSAVMVRDAAFAMAAEDGGEYVIDHYEVMARAALHAALRTGGGAA